MYFSTKEFHNWLHAEGVPSYRLEQFERRFGKATLKNVEHYVKAAKTSLLNREGEFALEMPDGKRAEYCGVWKWYRPWDIVPKLRNWKAPEGDYGVGVEVELGFVDKPASKVVAQWLRRFRHVTLDFEGGQFPIEATFAPVRYSQLSKRTAVFRYLEYLRDNEHLVVKHGRDTHVGTHINVSKGGVDNFDYGRSDVLHTALGRLTPEEKYKYFDRIPYGYNNVRESYVEYKLFNSTTDSAALRRYINIAVALTDLLASDRRINIEAVRAACELGYNK